MVDVCGCVGGWELNGSYVTFSFLNIVAFGCAGRIRRHRGLPIYFNIYLIMQ